MSAKPWEGRTFAAWNSSTTGKVVHDTKADAAGGYYVADLRHGLEIDQPGWFALRIPLDAGKTELGRPLFAHTSPIYVSMNGRKLFDVSTAQQLVKEMKTSLNVIGEKGQFADQAERDSVATVYEAAIQQMQAKIAAAR